MAPHGLTITKLAVQISADDEVAHTLLCLKISLSRDVESKQGGQWNVFHNGISRLASEPQIHSLPLSHDALHKGDHIRAAALLLSLSPEPVKLADQSRPSPPTISASSSGQIAVSFDSSTPRKKIGNGASSPGGGRREFLIVLEYEQSVDDARGWFKLPVPLPKCLDNILRFQVMPPRASSSSSTGEVSIVTEPKILPVPPTTFSPRQKPVSKGTSLMEDGWEDGEAGGLEDTDSESEGGGNWLEGRFQSTESLRLEWSFASSSSQIPSLHLAPIWHPRSPAIDINYEAGIFVPSLEAVLPAGWGWSELKIEGEGLLGWSCSDGAWWDAALSSSVAPNQDTSMTTERPDEDSFAAIRARRNLPLARSLPSLTRSGSGASLMRQPLPQPDPSFDEFSFELNSLPAPATPASHRKGSLLSQSQVTGPPGVLLAKPAAGRLFDLSFSSETEEMNIHITGKLLPLSKIVLVSPSVPIPVPVVRPSDGEGQCHFTNDSSIIDVLRPPALAWSDQRGQPVRSSASSPISGDISVSLERSRGVIRMVVSFSWPKNSAEVSLTLPGKEYGITVTKVEMRGRALARAAVAGPDGVDLWIGTAEGAEGVCTVEVEVDEDNWGLPSLRDASGYMSVELLGKGWHDVKTNLTKHSASSYSTMLPPSQPISFTHGTHTHSTSTESASVPRSPRFRAVWSWSTLIIVFMLYLLLSMAQQVQRLRDEVVFIREEAKDMRIYVTGLEERVSQVGVYSWERNGRDHEAGKAQYKPDSEGHVGAGEFARSTPERHWDHSKDTAPGRLVLSRTGWNWDTWVRHPTVKSLSKSLGWLWHTVVWLVHA